jgi:hypothetical protein
MAARIAMNRCFAGVHYPIDQYAGAMLGDYLGGLAVQKVFGVFPFKAALTSEKCEVEDAKVKAETTVERRAINNPLLQRVDLKTAPNGSGLLGQLSALVCAEL